YKWRIEIVVLMPIALGGNPPGQVEVQDEAITNQLLEHIEEWPIQTEVPDLFVVEIRHRTPAPHFVERFADTAIRVDHRRRHDSLEQEIPVFSPDPLLVIEGRFLDRSQSPIQIWTGGLVEITVVDRQIFEANDTGFLASRWCRCSHRASRRVDWFCRCR